MIRRFGVFFLLIISCLGILAQTPISRATNTMRSGDILYKLKVDYVDAGNAGQGKVWTLGRVTDDSEEYLQSIAAKGDTIAILEKGNILHYLMHGDTLFYKGHQQRRAYQLYDKERPVMRYPFHYGDSISGNYNGKGWDENLELSVQGWGYSVADGIGVLTDGTDTLRHVTRLHLFDDYVESYGDQADFHLQSHQYLWFCAGYRYPVMESIQKFLVEDDNTVTPTESVTYMYLPTQQYDLGEDASNDSILQQLAIADAQQQRIKDSNTTNGANSLSSINAFLSADGMYLTVNYTLSTNADLTIYAFDALGNMLGTSYLHNIEAGEWQEYITLNRKPIAYVLMLNVRCGEETISLKVNRK